MEIKGKKPTILMAITGGLESTVAAYLLKKQGYNCIGISFKLFNDGEYLGPFSDFAVSDFSKIKDICAYLDIPFYVVDATEKFQDKVLDPMVGRILSGHTFEPMVFLNTVIFDLLLEKAKKFNANLIASGHYAKVLKNQRTGSFELMTANDVEHDQSYFLSHLEQRHLENLILPLSEIRKKEVEKIGELLKVNYVPRPKNNLHHVMRDGRTPKLVEERSTKDLRKVGNIYDYSSDTSICEHNGIHHFFVGKKKLEVRSEIKIDENKEVVMIVPYKGNIFIDYPDKLSYRHVLITCFDPSKNLDTSLPLNAYVKKSSGTDLVACKLYFKNNRFLLVEFDNDQKGIVIPGQFFVFYNKNTEKRKVLGSGIVEIGGSFSEDEINTLPKKKEDSDDESPDIGVESKLQF